MTTGFKIGSLLTEWLSQVQTAPTLRGYIEGSLPVPRENWRDKNESPTSAVTLISADKEVWTYTSRGEHAFETGISGNIGYGIKSETSVSAIAVETKAAETEAKYVGKLSIDWAGGSVESRANSSTNAKNEELRS